jgi:hypothetical protein
MKTVVILGAGAVRAAAGKRPVKSRPPLDCDFFEIAEKRFPAHYAIISGHVRNLVGAYADEVLKSLENTTTFLYLKALDSKHREPAHLAFMNLLDLLARELGHTTNDLSLSPKSMLYRFLKKEIGRLPSPESLTVITFNYDLTIERTLESLQTHLPGSVFNYPGCYRLPLETPVTHMSGAPRFADSKVTHEGVAVLKLHGSLNWVSTHTSETPTPAAMFRPNRDLYILNSTKIAARMSWTRRSRKMYIKPIILPPVTGKRSLLHQQFGSIWSCAADALESANRVVIVGYSCPPLDFEARMLLGEHVQPSVTRDLVVVDPNPATAARFVSLCGLSRCSVFTSLKALVEDSNTKSIE